MVEVYGHLKMGYSDGAYDSKAWSEITHFKATGEEPLLKGIIKKKTPLLRHIRTFPAFSIEAFLWFTHAPAIPRGTTGYVSA